MTNRGARNKSGLDDPQNSTPFDVYKWSDYPQVKHVADLISNEWVDVEKHLLKHHIRELNRHLRKVLLNLYVTYKADPLRYVGYSRTTNDYVKNTRYKKLHIKRVPLIRAIDRLDELGYVDYVKGFPHKVKSKKGFNSKVRAKPQLIELFNKHKVSLNMVSDEQVPLLVLRDRDKNDVTFRKTKAIKKIEADLTSYNDLLAKTYIDLNETSCNDIKPDKLNKKVRRIFNNTFKEGGRYYGGWWLNMPSEYRSCMVIDGKPIGESDFSHLHIALLYALEGVDGYNDPDPYEIWVGIPKRYEDDKTVRDLVKLIFLTMLNARSKGSAKKAVIFDIFENPKRYPNISLFQKGSSPFGKLDDIFDTIISAHKPIQHHFFTGIGLKLQYQDSIMATEIINYMTQIEKLPILSFHDGFVYCLRDEVIVYEQLEKAYKSFLERVSEQFKINLPKLPKLKVIRMGLKIDDRKGGEIDRRKEARLCPDDIDELVSLETAQDLRETRWRETGNCLPFD